MVNPFGFLNIDKPLHLTSHDVVARVRRTLGIKKVGHAGTLDPLATGVLIVCVGTATRLSEYVMSSTKTYRASVMLGLSSTTYDAEGDIIQTKDASYITRQQVEAVFPQFLGEIDQYPPIYSAIKQNGRKLYELARAGNADQIERQARQVRIDDISIVRCDFPEFVIDVTCGSGTYIRSLAHDIGEALGVGAYLSGLIRTSSGSFTLKNAVALDTLMENENPEQFLISPEIALVDYPRIELDTDAIQTVQKGQQLPDADFADDTLIMAYDSAGKFVAVLKAQRGNWRPHKVFSSV